MELTNVIIKPYNTEKTYGLRKFSDPSCLCFVVDKKANKTEIKKAFISLYNIVPEKINVLVRKPKKLRYTTTGLGYSKMHKLAYVILPKGVQVAITRDEIEEANNAANAKEENSEKKIDKKTVKEAESKEENIESKLAKETKTKKPEAKKANSK